MVSRGERKELQKAQASERKRKAKEDWEKLTPTGKAVQTGLGCGLLLLIGSCAVWLGSPGEKEPQRELKTALDAQVGVECGSRGRVTQKDYAVRTTAILRKLPRDNAEAAKVTVGENSSDAIVDSSTDVREICRAGGWSEVRIVSPQELRTGQGWLRSTGLEEVVRSATGRRIYNAGDLDWPANLNGDKSAVLTVINRVIEQRPSCDAIDRRSLTVKGGRGPKTFLIACNGDSEGSTIEFTAADAKNGRSFAPVEPIGREDASLLCRAAVLSRTNHPSTVEFDLFGKDFERYEDGEAQFISSFTASNSFNLQLRYRVVCSFLGPKLTSMGFEEATQ